MASEKIWNTWDELLGKEDLEPMEVLKAAAMYERYFQEVEHHAVDVARAEGHSWQEIADVVGVSKQTAWAKWSSPEQKRRQKREPSARFEEFPVKAPDDAAEVFDSMVVQVVDSLTSPDDPRREELLRAGRQGLADAIASHGSTTRAVPFAVFASWWIRQAVIRQLYGTSPEKP
jgi:hypothetical protein